MEEKDWLLLAEDHGFERAPVAWFMMGVDQEGLIKFVNAVLDKAVEVCQEAIDDYDDSWECETDVRSIGRIEASGRCRDLIEAMKIRENADETE